MIDYLNKQPVNVVPYVQNFHDLQSVATLTTVTLCQVGILPGQNVDYTLDADTVPVPGPLLVYAITFSGAGNHVLQIEHSNDGLTWFTILSSPLAAALGWFGNTYVPACPFLRVRVTNATGGALNLLSDVSFYSCA